MTTTPHCDRFLRDVKPTRLTPEDRRKIHHLLHALECNYVDVPELLYEAADTMRTLAEADRLTWANYMALNAPSAGQIVWNLGHAAGLLKMKSAPTTDGQTHFSLFNHSDLLTAIDDTVALWRSGRLVEDVVTTKDPEPTKHADPEPPMTEQPPQPSLYERVAALRAAHDKNDRELEYEALRSSYRIMSRGLDAVQPTFSLATKRYAAKIDLDARITDLRLANLDAPWDPARVFADTEEAKANMTAAIEAMADPWYQPFSRKDFILRGPVEQTDARKALLSFAIYVDALNLDRDRHGDTIYNVLNASTFHSKVRARITQRKAIWRRLEA